MESPQISLVTKLEAAANAVRARLGKRPLPTTLVVLGSGFKGIAKRIAVAESLDLAGLAHFPLPRVVGHGCSLLVGSLPGAGDVCVLTGRVHLYEGHSADDVVFALRALARLGVKDLLLTNAAGGVNPTLAPGSLVVLADQLNLTGHNCLRGEAAGLGPVFVDMAACFDTAWRAALKAELNLSEGIYAGVLGPSYETPAEVRYLRAMGADLVGMSTVQEVIAARQLGLRVAALSFVTNMAGGSESAVLSHGDVVALVEANARHLEDALIKAVAVRPPC